MAGPNRNIGRPIASGTILRFLVAAGIAVALLVATYGSFVLSASGQRLENLGLAGAGLRSESDRLESLGNLSQISILSFAVALSIIVAVALARHLLGLGLLIAAVMGASVVTAEVLKELLPRPELFPAAPWLLRNTFPSGTATVAAAIGVGGILIAPDRLRWVVIPVAAAYASAIGQSTQIAGWHRLSGAVGGVLLVIAFASVAMAVLADRGRLVAARTSRPPTRVVAALFIASGGIVALAALIAALPVAFPVMLAPTGAGSAFAHTALDLIGVGATIAAFAAFGLLLHPFSLRPDQETSPPGDMAPFDRIQT